MLNKYIFLIVCLFVSIDFAAQTIPPPNGLECCDKLLEETGDEAAYEACVNSSNPGAYCSAALPIDNSIYVYALLATGFVLASVVIFKTIKRKKTPM